MEDNMTSTRVELCRKVLHHVRAQERSSVQSVSTFIRPHVETIDDGIYIGAFIEYLLGIVQSKGRAANDMNAEMAGAIIRIMSHTKAEA